MLFVFKKMLVCLKYFLLNISLPPLPPPTAMNSKKVSYSTDKLFFIQTCGVQSCVLVLLVVGWKPELMAALRELTDEPIRRGINTRKGNWPSAGPSVIPTWCSTAICPISPLAQPPCSPDGPRGSVTTCGTASLLYWEMLLSTSSPIASLCLPNKNQLASTDLTIYPKPLGWKPLGNLDSLTSGLPFQLLKTQRWFPHVWGRWVRYRWKTVALATQNFWRFSKHCHAFLPASAWEVPIPSQEPGSEATSFLQLSNFSRQMQPQLL